jgi:hypothetical protein
MCPMRTRRHVKDDAKKGMVMQSFSNNLLKSILFLFYKMLKLGRHVVTTRGKKFSKQLQMHLEGE